LTLLLLVVPMALAQDKSVKPGINDPFKKPNVKEYLGKFEVESREIYSHRDKVVAAVGLKPGMSVADVGAGTGLYTRLFAPKVTPGGTVYAVDISREFLDHIAQSCKDAKIDNVRTIRCTQMSAELPEASVDLVFVCDTYHHFEFPFRTMASIYKALKPGGKLVIIDFHRIPGKTREWVLNHVRAGQDVVTKEITTSGFKFVREEKFLEENYFMVFERVEK
jgi:predicted methyltransferase